MKPPAFPIGIKYAYADIRMQYTVKVYIIKILVTFYVFIKERNIFTRERERERERETVT